MGHKEERVDNLMRFISFCHLNSTAHGVTECDLFLLCLYLTLNFFFVVHKALNWTGYGNDKKTHGENENWTKIENGNAKDKQKHGSFVRWDCLERIGDDGWTVLVLF